MKKISLLLIVVLCLFCQAKADDALTLSAVTELTPTAIQSLPVTTAAPSTVYDLLGRRVGVLGDHLPKGLYVANGKKFIIK